MHTNLLLRHDTFFGVCEAIGQDFGFHANWLRLGLAVTLFFNPLATAGAYAVLGALVLATRLLFPDRHPAAVAEGNSAPAMIDAERSRAADQPLPLAA